MNPVESALHTLEAMMGEVLFAFLFLLPLLLWALWPCYRVLRYWWWRGRKAEDRRLTGRLVDDLPVALRLEGRCLWVASSWSGASSAQGDHALAPRLGERIEGLGALGVDVLEGPQATGRGPWVLGWGRSVARVTLDEGQGNLRVYLQGWVRTVPGILPLALSGYFVTLFLVSNASRARLLLEMLPLPSIAFLGWILGFLLALIAGWVFFVLLYHVLGMIFLWVRTCRLPDEDAVEDHQALVAAVRSAIEETIAEFSPGGTRPEETWMPTPSPLLGWRVGRFGIG